jgi:hypothetical protein
VGNILKEFDGIIKRNGCIKYSISSAHADSRRFITILKCYIREHDKA